MVAGVLALSSLNKWFHLREHPNLGFDLRSGFSEPQNVFCSSLAIPGINISAFQWSVETREKEYLKFDLGIYCSLKWTIS